MSSGSRDRRLAVLARPCESTRVDRSRGGILETISGRKGRAKPFEAVKLPPGLPRLAALGIDRLNRRFEVDRTDCLVQRCSRCRIDAAARPSRRSAPAASGGPIESLPRHLSGGFPRSSPMSKSNCQCSCPPRDAREPNRYLARRSLHPWRLGPCWAMRRTNVVIAVARRPN